MSIEISVEIPAARDTVWAEVADLASHAEWMADAESIRFATEFRTGPGTVMRVTTRVGPLRTEDVMEVTDWVAGERISVTHRGLVSGSGSFTLSDTPNGGTLVTWTETLRFPPVFGGKLGATLARPMLRWIWHRNLIRLRDRIVTGVQ